MQNIIPLWYNYMYAHIFAFLGVIFAAENEYSIYVHIYVLFHFHRLPLLCCIDMYIHIDVYLYFCKICEIQDYMLIVLQPNQSISGKPN